MQNMRGDLFPELLSLYTPLEKSHPYNELTTIYKTFYMKKILKKTPCQNRGTRKCYDKSLATIY